MLARSLPSILPRMTSEEALDATKIYSISGALPSDCPLIAQRPFRAPHYSISNAGLVGGGRSLRPGEITLSHRGVLFLDELPEFDRTALESLRQPLEDKVVTISRVTGSVTYPASFMLVAAQNPCPCGYYSHPRKDCTCSASAVARYQKRISGPLMDRIDIFVEVPPVEYEKLVDEGLAEDSEVIRRRVERAREGAGAEVRRRAGTLQFGNERRRGLENLPVGRWRPEPAANGHQPAQPVGPGLPPHRQGLPHHRRPGRLGNHQRQPPG